MSLRLKSGKLKGEGGIVGDGRTKKAIKNKRTDNRKVQKDKRDTDLRKRRNKSKGVSSPMAKVIAL